MLGRHLPTGQLAKRERVAGAERAGTDHATGLDQLGRGEEVLRPDRIVQAGRDPVGDVEADLVVPQGPVAAVLAVVMRVHVDEPGDYRAARGIDHPVGAAGVAGADTGDARSVHHDRAALDDLVVARVGEGDDTPIGEGHRARNGAARHDQADVERFGLPGAQVVTVVPAPAAELQRVRVTPAKEQAAGAAELADGQAAASSVECESRVADSRPRQRRDVHVVGLLEGDPAAVGRGRDLVGGPKDQVSTPVLAVGPHRDDGGAPVDDFREEDATFGPPGRREDRPALDPLGAATGRQRDPRDGCRVAAICGDADEIPPRVVGEGAASERGVGAPADDDLAAVGAPGGMHAPFVSAISRLLGASGVSLP